MRATPIVTMAMLAVGSAPAEELRGQAAPAVLVYVQDAGGVPPMVLIRAQPVAAEMFSGIEIRLTWRSGKPSARDWFRERYCALATSTTSLSQHNSAAERDELEAAKPPLPVNPAT